MNGMRQQAAALSSLFAAQILTASVAPAPAMAGQAAGPTTGTNLARGQVFAPAVVATHDSGAAPQFAAGSACQLRAGDAHGRGSRRSADRSADVPARSAGSAARYRDWRSDQARRVVFRGRHLRLPRRPQPRRPPAPVCSGDGNMRPRRASPGRRARATPSRHALRHPGDRLRQPSNLHPPHSLREKSSLRGWQTG